MSRNTHISAPYLQTKPLPGLYRRTAVRVMAFTPDSLDNASILVCGGGGVALDVTRKLKEAGSWVWQLQRTDVRRSVGLELC